MVAGDFNGGAWQRTTNANNISIIEEAFADCDLPMPPGPTPLWSPGAVPGSWSDVCRFLKPPDSNERWRVRQHGAFPILHEAPGINKPIRVAIRSMASHGLCGATQWPCASRKTRTTKGTKQARMQATIRFLQRTRRPVATNTGADFQYGPVNTMQPFIDLPPFQFIKAISI